MQINTKFEMGYVCAFRDMWLYILYTPR